jgi:NADH:ubiquinone oxidoreductase subunit 5 (subunit L)/multisubunit Na+/H+ antiporter MnhA subunit
MFNTKLIFTIGGLLVGVIGVAFGPLEAFVVLLLTVVGWLIGKYAAGEMHAVDVFLERFFSNRLGGPRD